MKNSKKYGYAATSTSGCYHHTGWYGRVYFGWFSKRIYTCSLCGEILQGKELREFENRIREIFKPYGEEIARAVDEKILEKYLTKKEDKNGLESGQATK